ncbi:Cytochrome c oxidase subunit 1 [Nocardioides sp. CF8]|uniref:hypothetical protein n=1 Tax=Nocardioides sp. CF8 TaxID=110319 RepID=UPI00032FD524|nr:hypothetical protein [Nocardioides sp. CF8]EON22012.1 Cytochrome c oxidase subunit 1 [Nocardioides sp. CF8]
MMKVADTLLATMDSAGYPGPALGWVPILAMAAVLVVPAIALIATIVYTNRCINQANREVPGGLGETTLQEELWRFLDELERGDLALIAAPSDHRGRPKPDRQRAAESDG